MKRSAFPWLVRLSLVALTLMAGACAMVRPWDRDLLSQPKMSLNPQPMVHAIDEHIYFSKEASTGGDDMGGGGCGCN